MYTVFLCIVRLFSKELRRENIPVFQETASCMLYFVIQKDVNDGSLDANFLQNLKSMFEVEIFIERGTYFGAMAAKASRI